MSDSRLLIDLGNSRVKWLWERGGKLDRATSGQGDTEDLQRAIRRSAAPQPREVLLASVAGPERTQEVAKLCQSRWRLAPQLLRARSEQGGVRSGYFKPETLGVDRWLVIVGAVARYGKPVVIWDLGTATTLDAVDGDGQHLGGWILPGPQTMLAALVRDTKLVVPRHLQDESGIEPGRSTAEGIRRGVIATQVGALERFMKEASGRIGTEPKLVVTGGAADDCLVERLAWTAIRDPWLVFRGMLVD